MAKNFFVNVNGEARKVKTWYVNVNGEARRVVKAYANVNGEARLFWDGSGEANHVIFYGGQLKYTPFGVDFEEFVRSVTSWNGTQSAYNMTDVVSSFFTNKCILKDPNNSNSDPFVLSSIIEQGNTLNHNMIGFFIPVQRIRNITGWRIISRDDKIAETKKWANMYFLCMTASSNGLRRVTMEEVGNGTNWFAQPNRDRISTPNYVDYVGFLISKPTYMPNPADPTECLMQIKTIELIGGRAYKIATHAESSYIEYAALTQYMMPRPEFDLTYLPNNTFFRFYASKTAGGAICTDESILIHVQPKENNQGLEIRFVSKTMFYLMQGTTREGQSTSWTTNNAVALTYNGLTYYSYFIRLDYLTYSYRESWYEINDRADFTFGTLATDKLAWEIAYICFNGTIS